MNLILLVGPPGSGKTTYAKKNYPDYVRISQDDHGKTEHLEMFKKAVSEGRNVIVDRMGFSREQRRRYTQIAKENSYMVICKVFYVPRSECFKRCNERFDHPTVKTPENANSALDTFFRFFERPEVHAIDMLDEVQHIYWSVTGDENDKPICIVSDLDGTLCNNDHRQHFMETDGFRSKKDWKGFFDGIPNDIVNEWCKDIIVRYDKDSPIVLCSGRPDNYRRLTEDWLEIHSVPYDHLFMRPHIDHRSDTIVKEIILDFEILPRYNVLFALDDRKCVVDMWRKRGVTCLACAEGNF